MEKKKRKFKLKIKRKENGKVDVKSLVLSIILIGAIAVVSLILVFALYVIISSPDFDKDKLYSKESTILYYKDGVSELARKSLGENRTLVTYDELPQVLIDAIIATEDSRFFQHNGLDVARFLKASAGQLVGNSGAGGASTITMQVVKQTYTSDTASGIEGLIRKFTDIYMAVFKIESNYTKEEILEFYVNGQWFAGDGSVNYSGIAGVEQACQHYFGKSVSDISLAEASIIAGMFQNPRLYNPYKNPVGVRNRQTKVLNYMVMHGYITEEERDAVLEIPVESLLVEKLDSNNSDKNQVIIDYVLSKVEEETGINGYYTPLKIYTTIDPNIQDVLIKLENGEIYTWGNDAIQEGIAVTSTEDGSVVAISGGRNYGTRGNNRARSRQQPGSTAKILFDYGPAIEYLNWSPATLILDEETTYSNGTKISNANRDYSGLQTMRYQLSHSRNIPALRTFKAVAKENINYISDFVHSLGINYGSELYESASIGGFDGISPIEMSAAYAAYGRGGYYIKPYVYTKIENLETGEVTEYKYEKVQVMSEETAYLITDMLMTTFENGVSGMSKVSGTQIAAKTGTTNLDSNKTTSLGIPAGATKDAWNVTYSSEYAIAVWIGYDQTTSENYLTVNFGTSTRKGVMKAIGSRIYSKNKTFTVPSGIVTVEVEGETIPTQLASEYTPADLRYTEKFKEGTEPTEVSTRFSKLASPSNGNYTFDGKIIKLTWTGIATPDAINNSYLQEYFNTYFDNSATKYYEKRLAYNKKNIGTLGYLIYEQDDMGNLTYLGRSEGTSFVINNPTGGNVTYAVKSAYSIFTANMSDSLLIRTNANIDSNVTDIVDTPTSPTQPSEEESSNELE